MTLFTLEGMVRARHAGVALIDEIRAAYLDWYRTQRGQWHATEEHRGLLAHSVLWRARAPGNTCMAALGGGGWGSTAAPINDSKGCGGVMRTAPLGFRAPEVEEATVYADGAEAGALTHGHPDGFAPAGAVALAVGRLLGDADWDSVIGSALQAVQVHRRAQGTMRLLEDVREALRRGGSAGDAAQFGQGWVGDEALAVGLYAAAAASGFNAAIEAATNHDGDSDSTASIAGQLYGAKHGLACLPADAVYRLDVLEPLLELHGRWAVRGSAG
jgi:ADP-ribosylglycohydrolase